MDFLRKLFKKKEPQDKHKVFQERFRSLVEELNIDAACLVNKGAGHFGMVAELNSTSFDALSKAMKLFEDVSNRAFKEAQDNMKKSSGLVSSDGNRLKLK